MGTGIGFQSIVKACTVLRNYGTFREPSFLAVWVAPTIPLYFYKAREKKYLIAEDSLHPSREMYSLWVDRILNDFDR